MSGPSRSSSSHSSYDPDIFEPLGDDVPFVDERLAYGSPPVVPREHLSKPSTKLKRYDNTERKKLCPRCQNIDWSKICQLATDDPYTRHKLFGLEEEWYYNTFDCQLCQLIQEMGGGEPVFALSLGTIYDLEYSVTLPQDTEASCATFLLHDSSKVLGISHLGSARERHAPRVIDAYFVDYDLIRSWIHHCSDHHETDDCVAKRTPNIPGFKVIDCRSSEVIPAPSHCIYVALSYVWGQQQPDKLTPRKELFSSTVQDSIAVCRNLGFDYLWVDQHCIDQENISQKQAQISKMDQIYSEASLTIIAEAGESGNDALPGVGETYPFAHIFLEVSKWASRAWTYQEAFLSKRKLVFSMYQVWFICGESYFAESFTDEVFLKATNEYLHSSLISNAAVSTRDNPIDIAMECLAVYSSRQMTYESDSLNACLGVLRRIATGPILGHVWGMLVCDTSCLFMSLAWYHGQLARRRHDFPSWSWAGWEGKISWGPRCDSRNIMIEVDLFTKDSFFKVIVLPSEEIAPQTNRNGERYTGNKRNRKISLSEWYRSGLLISQAGDPNAPRLLHLTGCCTKFKILENKPSILEQKPTDEFYFKNCALFVACKLSHNIYQLYGFFPDYDINSEGLASCIAMANDMFRNNHLVLKPIGDKFERVGLLVFFYFADTVVDELCYENGDMLQGEDREGIDKYGMVHTWFENTPKLSIIVQ